MVTPQDHIIDGKYRTGGIPQAALHVLLERLMKQWISDYRKGAVDSPRHPSFLIAYHKAFQVKRRVIAISPQGKALSLLKSGFAKKPKNPV